jgi:transposase
VVHPHAAGIDIGAGKHFVAVGEGQAPQPVRSFGCTAPELREMALWLHECGVATAALESTGVYWIPAAAVLDEESGIDVYLVDARQARNIPGRKSDVRDCQWLQQLHRFGLPARAFRPAAQIQPLRALWRHRRSLVERCSGHIHLMHKSLEQMNVQLHKVLTDVTGVTGMRILRAVIEGKRDPLDMVRLCHPLCKRPKEEFVKALAGHCHPEQIFVLTQAVEACDFYQGQLAACDDELQHHLDALPQKADKQALARQPDGKRRDSKRRKNQPHFDLRAELFALTGVDLTQIEGIDALTAFTVITEQGIDMSRFPDEKHFASHLGLCPNHRITGGRVKKRSTRNVTSRAATALRLAAQSLRRSNSALAAFCRHMHARLGAPKAITATAHKLAKLIYRLLRYGEAYVKQGQEQYEAKRQEILTKQLIRRAKEIGC